MHVAKNNRRDVYLHRLEQAGRLFSLENLMRSSLSGLEQVPLETGSLIWLNLCALEQLRECGKGVATACGRHLITDYGPARRGDFPYSSGKIVS